MESAGAAFLSLMLKISFWRLSLELLEGGRRQSCARERRSWRAGGLEGDAAFDAEKELILMRIGRVGGLLGLTLFVPFFYSK